MIGLTVAFVWQLYTLYLMVQLHENHETGLRYSRYLQLACATFGKYISRSCIHDLILLGSKRPNIEVPSLFFNYFTLWLIIR